MAGGKKTDNVSLSSKIAIRRWLLERMGLTEISVLDTCAGLGKVWGAMEDHVTIRQWTRCDTKPRRAGVLKIEALDAIKKMPLDTFNVVDIDPYGEPWHPYHAFLARFTRPTAVFLTHGHVMQSQVSNDNLRAAGIPEGWDVPKTPSLSTFIAKLSLEATWRFATIEHAATIHFPRVTYYALGLSPLSAAQENARG